MYVLFYLYISHLLVYRIEILTAGWKGFKYCNGIFVVCQFLLLFELQQKFLNFPNTPLITNIFNSNITQYYIPRRKSVFFEISYKLSPSSGLFHQNSWHVCVLFCVKVCICLKETYNKVGSVYEFKTNQTVL